MASTTRVVVANEVHAMLLGRGPASDCLRDLVMKVLLADTRLMGDADLPHLVLTAGQAGAADGAVGCVYKAGDKRWC